MLFSNKTHNNFLISFQQISSSVPEETLDTTSNFPFFFSIPVLKRVLNCKSVRVILIGGQITTEERILILNKSYCS